MEKIILSDLSLVFPPLSSLPEAKYSFSLCRLTQYPARDKERNIIEGEYTNCCFTSAFGKQANLALGNGKTLSLTASKWRRNANGIITNPSSDDQLTFWFEDTEEDQEKLEYIIANNMFYVYGNTDNPDDDLMFPDTYKAHIAKMDGQSKVTPLPNADPEQRINANLSGG